jgi:Putative Flp pilus-assembly TadE/G-like/Putative Tad-like Flp pilus-assembly
MPSSESRIEALARRLRQEGGQVLPLTALMMAVLIGFGALVVDVGRVYLAQRQLQNAVDSTAVAVAQNMPDDYAGWCQAVGSSASLDCASLTPAPPPLGYSGIKGGQNALFGYGVTANAPTVTFMCSPSGPGYTNNQCLPQGQDKSTQDVNTPCQPGTSAPPQPATKIGCNAVKVTETATVDATLAGIFGIGKFNLSASGTATAPDQTITPIDAAVVVDTTGSMGDPAANGVCPGIRNPDKLDCVKSGIQTLLQQLYPCTPGSACGGNNGPLDKVELLIFPGLTSTNLRAREEDCTQNLQNPLGNFKEYDDDQNKTVNPFTSEGYTYTVVPWESSFANWSTAQNKFVLTPTDPLVEAVQTGNCGLEPGGNTSFSAVLQAAQASFSTLPNGGNDDANHAIIFLGDGDANYGPIYTSPNEPPASPDRHTPCQQAVANAQQATAAGITIYSIGYWEGNGDQTQQCLGMTNQTGCRYGMTSAHMTQEFGNNCAEPNVSGATWPAPPACPALPRGADVIAGCWTMYNLASSPADFFPDASNTSLDQIFKQIGTNLGKTRLVP